MTRIAIVGCGVIGAAIAYELSQVAGLEIVVVDRQLPAQASTGAALGILVGVVSQKIKGNAWALRQTSLQRYETLIPELAAITGHSIPWNRQGIVELCFEGEDLDKWQKLVETRHDQGWQLELWNRQQLAIHCPHIQSSRLIGAVYSPQDRQVNPTALTLALVAAAEKNGVTFQFNVVVDRIEPGEPSQVQTTQGAIAADWVILTSGVGCKALTQSLTTPIDVRPVLGQALRLKLDRPLGQPDFQPVISGSDIHLVPLGEQQYWVGATVEFPDEAGTPLPADEHLLQSVLQQAIEFCPGLDRGEVLQRWSGLRPRPQNRPAPIIEPLRDCPQIIVATGHYRNGVLLAPATALKVKDLLGLAT
jgi:glycine/D-amino acid oxidase-like deaminating enzyme